MRASSRPLKTPGIRGAVVMPREDGAMLSVRRGFAIEGTIDVDFVATKSSKPLVFQPRVRVNFPSCNKDVVRACAFMALVNELVLLAASLQVQLDEFAIMEKKEPEVAVRRSSSGA